ncbi:hypothetical protein KC359_g8924 [Hortaea werneckii]|nr:hypothetical protein KC359_g8924 [Hortaea werneckii]
MYFLLAGTARSPIWDPIGGSTGMMMFCLISSAALSKNMLLDFSKTENVDEREFEGGFVLEPETGCYKGVVVIDGNSLYGSIMSKIGIFIDRCMSSVTAHGLVVKLGLPDLLPVLEQVRVDDVVEHEDLILMRSENSYMCVKKGPVTILNAIIDGLINSRKVAKEEGDQIRAAANKLCTVSIFGSLGSRHGIISSKTCAEIVTYLGRYYVRLMMRASEECGYRVLYGDTDSIFIWVGGKTETSCMTGGSKVKRKIIELTKGTIFSDVGADIKGNYESIVISAKKKYQAVLWDGSLETKGLAMVKKDSLPIVRYCLSMTLGVLNSPFDYDKKITELIKIVSGVMKALQNGKLPMSSQVTETKINAQPHIVYVDNNMKKRKILIGIGVKPSDVSKKWVARRIVSALDSVLIPVGMSNVSQLLFGYESKRRMKVSAV